MAVNFESHFIPYNVKTRFKEEELTTLQPDLGAHHMPAYGHPVNPLV